MNARFQQFAALGVVLAIAATATAQITSGPGGPATPVISIPVPQDPLSGQFNFGSPASPVPVSYATGAGSFEKVLKPNPDQNNDGVVDATDFSQFLSTTHTLSEFLQVGPGPSWTDWHENILTPGWDWGNVSIVTPGVVGPTNLVINQAGPSVDFFFDPLPPGTNVLIRKQLHFSGQPNTTMQADFLAGNYEIRVAEYPTSVPEPTALPLVGLALAGFAMVRLRRRWDDQAQHGADV
jgi:hypothetical protein